MRRTRRWIAGLIVVAASVLGAATAPRLADAERPSQDDVEAAYLYNFGKFVRWPEGPAHAPMTICVANQDALREIVSRLVQGEQIEGRTLEARTLDRSEQTGGCSILFIGGVERERLDAYLSAAAGKPVLTVGDAPDFAARGGIIQFVLTQDHVRFAVNLDAARRNHLQLSSELLKVALQVTGQPGMGGTQ